MDTKFPLKKRILFVGIVIIFAFLLLEGMARLFLSHMQTEPVVPPNLGRFDPLLGWSLEPSSLGTSSRTGNKIVYRINANGLRDDETSYNKPSDTFRIVLLGDSRTFGYGVPIDKHFSMLIEGYFKAVEVINMGVSGFGVDQELLYLRSEGFKYAPDLVIVYVAHYGNHRHMHDERWGKKKPRFLLHSGDLVLTNSHVKMNPLQSQSTLREAHYKLINKSKAYEIINDRIIINVLQGPPKSPNESDNYSFKSETDAKKMYALGNKIVYTMHEESLRNGAKLVLVTQIPQLYEFASDEGLFVINVSPQLSNKFFKLPANLKHVNECGNGVLAWEIVQYLKRKQLIPSKHF